MHHSVFYVFVVLFARGACRPTNSEQGDNKPNESQKQINESLDCKGDPGGCEKIWIGVRDFCRGNVINRQSELKLKNEGERQ